ncbi:putative baseplate assembly protein [Nostoc sp. LEGE 12447]|uniref:putative baseplate assembly protein n=1 Tax=Nostoc sp. LEGE 12447 TaxID=1828640 RepID=UPI0016842240|nr:putative baseplate assembly protein [Nostoc sp. LEGE 12447]MBD2511500.1 putative baseplate assembly protein [Desmonostoc muscorum FACHB-395]MBE9001900.1 putative baseplate assembly protein [Nostoc sp. LEGE 12447]
MNELILTCQDEQRRHEVRRRHLNGLDYLEVSDDQLYLCVHFVGEIPQNITAKNIQIIGGERIQNIQVTGIELEIQEDQTLDSCLRVYVNKFGDFSNYILRLVGLKGIDHRYAELHFNFKVGCPSDLDCQTEHICTEEEGLEPEINYLAKDYASFRQLILDRLALIMPDWKERHVPDLGITLVELLAYVGDYLSYYQDAVATEAYLDTSRLRISARRHGRLVDYAIHEGCNARTWVWLETGGDVTVNLIEIYFITKYVNSPIGGTVLKTDDLRNIPSQSYEVFKPISQEQEERIFYQFHNTIHFYTWGDRQCCIPKGATSATLLDAYKDVSTRQLYLKVGDILIFEEIKGAKTGNIADADITRRHAVRLTEVRQDVDHVYLQALEGVEQELPTPVVEISWAIEDALPFALCISAIGQAPECQLIENISVVHGNVILVDHGRSLTQDLGPVETKQVIAICESEGQIQDTITVSAPFTPTLKYTPLTFCQPLTATELKEKPASQILTQNPRQALPDISLKSDNHITWTPQADLLASYNQDKYFVVEIDNDGNAHLRFGNGEFGKIPTAGSQFQATYRVGNGIAGNIGADTIAYAVSSTSLGVSLIPHNPLPARGGTPPEPLSEVKLFAPHTFRKELQRAITPQDYADIVIRDFGDTVQKATAILRRTVSWDEMLVVIDPLQNANQPDLLSAIADHLHRYRRIGHDVVVKLAIHVPLDIAMTVCVKPNYLRGQVKAALLNTLSNRLLPNGKRGFFHPDNLTFGTSITLSKLVAAGIVVPGVENLIITRLQRLDTGKNGELEQGFLSFTPLEIPQLDNNPNFPEQGKLILDMRGGR